MSNVLDRLPSALHQEMVRERRFDPRSTAGGRGRRAPAAETVEMSRLQPAQGRPAYDLLLLVREGDRPSLDRWPSAALLWPNLRQAEAFAQELPAPLRIALSRRTLLTLLAHGTNADLLLRQEQLDTAMRGDELRLGVELWRDMRGPTAVRRTYLFSTLPRRALWSV